MKSSLSSALFALLLLAAVPSHAQLVRQPNSTLVLPSTLPNATGYTTENALGTLTFVNPIDVAVPPGVTDRLFVVERGGRIQMVNLTTLGTPTVFLDLPTFLATQGASLSTSGESGLLSMAFHPNYNQNGFVFVFYSVRIPASTGQLHQRVARFTANGTPGTYNAATSINTATHQPLITQLDQASNHNGGDLAFGPADGLLYISVGDEGDADDTRDNARRINKDFFGAILRLDVDQPPRAGSIPPNAHDESSTATVGDSAIGAGSYRIPAGNPFIGFTSYNGFTFPATQVRTEIWATGMRNPWRMNFDPPTGRLFVADVGQNLWEEINIVTSGFNGGWSWREGLHPHTPPAPTAEPPGFAPNPPIYEYSHGSGSFQGESITGGIVYRGTRLTELTGQYIFADYVDGHIWAIAENTPTWNVSLLFNEATLQIGGIGADPRNGDVLFCFTGSATGQVKRLVRTFTGGTPPPALLSQTAAFSSLATLTPNTGIVPYEPNVSFWSDYALKSRWFSIPSVASDMAFSQDGLWTFPAGQIWIKHFDLELQRGVPASPKKRLETRFLVKNATGAYGITYKWRADNSDADLVGAEGLDETITVDVGGTPTPQVWHYPSRNECMTCHTAATGHALSFNTRQLNRLYNHGIEQNQIAALSNAGYFTPAVPSVNNLPAFSRANDATKSLEHRVRSYLAVNCIQCHQPGFVPGNWDARPTTATDLAGLINGPLVTSGGDTLNRWCVPGDTGHSMILKRLQGAGVPRMPTLATNVIDQPAIDLITEWITTTLTSRQNFAQWQAAHFPTPADPADALAAADPDDDGQRNDFEFLTGTDPLDATALYTLAPSVSGGTITLTFPLPANRAVLIETSTDLQTWSLWDVPANAPDYRASPQTRVLTAPLDGTQRFFRAWILEQ